MYRTIGVVQYVARILLAFRMARVIVFPHFNQRL